MVVSKDTTLPSEEELTVQEVNVSTAGLRAASFHMGKYCENANNVSLACCYFSPDIIITLTPTEIIK